MCCMGSVILGLITLMLPSWLCLVHNEAPSNDVTYSEVTSREASNKMPVIQSEMVYSTLRTNTTGTEMRDKSRKTRDTLRLIHLL